MDKWGKGFKTGKVDGEEVTIGQGGIYIWENARLFKYIINGKKWYGIGSL